MAFPRNCNFIGCTDSYNIYTVITLYPITVSGCNVLSGVNISDELPSTTAPPTEAIDASQPDADSADANLKSLHIAPTQCKPGALSITHHTLSSIPNEQLIELPNNGLYVVQGSFPRL